MSGNEAMPAAKSKNGDCVFNRDSTRADVQVNDAQPARAGEAEIQLVYTVETLMPLVLANAPQGSAVVSAFTKFYHANENDLDGQIIDDVLHAAQVAMSQWAVLPEELRERYANGWYMPVGYPTVSRFFAEESSHDDLSTAWFIDITLTSGRKIHIRALSIEDACDPTIGKGLAKFRTALVKQTANTIKPTPGEISNGGGVYFDVAAILREAGDEGRAAFQAAIDIPLGSIPIANISEVMEAYIKQNVSVDALKQEFKFLFDVFCEAAGVPKKKG